jgi:hypothetical protein
MRRAARQVDVAAVGRVAERDDVEAERLEQPLRVVVVAPLAMSTAIARPQTRRRRQQPRSVLEIGSDEVRSVDVAWPPAPTFHDGSAMIASTARSSRSPNFSPGRKTP